MSKFEDGSYGSLTGIALIAKVLAGRCKMRYTRAAVGNGAIPDDLTPKTMAGCAGYVMDAKIAAVTNPIDGECQVTVQIKSDDVVSGFYATNIVLFAEDPDEGEVPYTYLSLENEPEWIRPASSIVGKLATFDLIAAVGDVDAVSAIIDPEAIATVGKVDQLIAAHNADPSAHGGMSAAVQHLITIPAADWVQGEDGEYMVDVLVPDVEASVYADVTLHKSALKAAFDAGLYPTVETRAGALRFWAVLQPAEDLPATVAIWGVATSITGGLPIAGEDTLGAVRVRDGSGLNIDEYGYLTVEKASAEDVENLFSQE